MRVTETPAGATAALAELEILLEQVVRAADELLARWQPAVDRPKTRASLHNLACYLCLRHHELRPLQRRLAALGLSSLGRIEGRVVANLRAVRAALARIVGTAGPEFPSSEAFFAGEHRLRANLEALLGTRPEERGAHILVTCPTEAATDKAFLRSVLVAGADAIRINCAHDDADIWARMVENLREAERQTGRPARVLMDLAGPKVRTGAVVCGDRGKRAMIGDTIRLVLPGTATTPKDCGFEIECQPGSIVDRLRVGDQAQIDDGKLAGRISATDQRGAVMHVERSSTHGVKLKPEKGLNFPTSELGQTALQPDDLQALDHVVRLADMVGYSFVQSAADVEQLQEELARRRPVDWRQLGLVAKIETPRAVAQLPEIIVAAATRQPFAVMIARGDLAVELGFERLAEMQEEILWLAEAAHVPVIWATQVLESLVKKGLPSRGDMTDAAMAARAECVMLNKGPYLLQAIAMLDRLSTRMAEHQHKKTSTLRPLRSW